MDYRDQSALFPLFLRDTASDWFESIPTETKHDIDALFEAFNERFPLNDYGKWKKTHITFQRKMTTAETVDAYVTDMKKLSKRLPDLSPEILKHTIISGFLPEIRKHVLQQQVRDIDELLKVAKIAEDSLNA